MQHIDAARLKTDLGYRFGYVAGFVGFGPEDALAVKNATGIFTPAAVHFVVDSVCKFPPFLLSPSLSPFKFFFFLFFFLGLVFLILARRWEALRMNQLG
jgi:hypothetical protein